MAGLLTFSPLAPSHPDETGQWQICQESFLRLQQRVLSRIYTWFPIVRKKCDNSGTITMTNIEKYSGWRVITFKQEASQHKLLFLTDF